MADKKSKKMMWIIVAVVVGFFLFKGGFNFGGAQVITGNEVMTRTVPSQVNPGQAFTVSYTVSNAAAPWGASIEDNIGGACTWPSGSAQYRTVMLSEDGATKSVTVTAPASGTCTFTGDYKFGSFPNVAFPVQSTSVCIASCVRPVDMCVEASTVSNGCGGMCTGSWTVTQVTSADADCSNSINRNELGVAINGWITGDYTRTDLGSAIQSWAVGG